MNAFAHEPDRQRIDVDGASLSVRVATPKIGKPTLVFVPGWTMPGDLFDAQFTHFARTHGVVVIDPRGQGQSSVPVQGYTLERRAQDIADVLTTLNLSDVILIGWSLGVLESLHLVQTDALTRQRIKALVLIDNSVGEATPPKGDPNFFSKLRAQRSATVNAFVKGMFTSNISPARVSALASAAQKMSVESSIALLSYAKPRTYWRDALYAWDKPFAYFVTPKFFAQADAVQATRADATVEKFPTAGHALFVDEAMAFNTALEKFLGRVRP